MKTNVKKNNHYYWAIHFENIAASPSLKQLSSHLIEPQGLSKPQANVNICHVLSHVGGHPKQTETCIMHEESVVTFLATRHR